VLRENGLSIVLGVLFLVFLTGQLLTGHRVYNEERRGHGESSVSLGDFATSGAFAGAVFENWESEFLQMFGYVLLSAYLFQKGSAESKKLDEPEAIDDDPRTVTGKNLANAPGPVRRGGLVLRLYEHSLSIAFGLLFLASMLAHAAGGVTHYNEEQLAHGADPISFGAYLTTARMWEESFQNWQSEFLAVGAIVVLSIFLRERGSPESKPVYAPHSHTGTS